MRKLLLGLLLTLPLILSAQPTQGNLSPISVQNGLLKDVNGNLVKLHGVSDSPTPALNGARWAEEATDANITRCTNYFTKLFSAVSRSDEGGSCNAFRLCLETAWAEDASLTEVEPAYKRFSATRMKNNTTKLYWKMIQTALKRGLYIVLSAPNDAPSTNEAGDDYHQYLMSMWDVLTKNDSILKYSGQISIELVSPTAGTDSKVATEDYIKPLVDKVRANGFGGVLWVPAVGEADYVTAMGKCPNIAYSTPSTVDDTMPQPLLLSEVKSKINTVRVGVDAREGVSVMLASTDDYVDVDAYLEDATVKPSSSSLGKVSMDWYASLSERYPFYRPFKHFWTADQGNGTFINPILNGDFPDIDIIRVDDTYYLISTTMYIFPGATIMKSKDLVNWEYCCNPLEKIDDNDAYNLLNGKEHYAQGQWATSLTYHDGQFYVYFISSGRGGVDSGRNVLLTAKNAEGPWKMQYMNDWYYDSGWMFDDGPDGDGSLYVASCNWASGTIYMNKLDPKTLKKQTSATVINGRDGTEGARMYHIGKYYYIYLTTGGYWRGQTIYRSEKPMGPYEEMPNLNGYGNAQSGNAFSGAGVHQGGMVQTQTGEWWTILFKDAGAIGRVPYLEPVEWKDGWPIIGNKGVEVSKGGKAYRKPNVGTTYPRTYLPTSDTFTSLELGKQWGWNHNHVDDKWSLLERPGHLRMHTVNVTNNLRFARNSLTQRIIGLNAEGAGTTKNVNSYGTVKMDVSGMMEGDYAGLSVYQDPYQLIGVTVRNGEKRIVYMTARSSGDWNPTEKLGPVLKSDTIYLRAIVNFSTDKSNLYYSYDNTKWTKYGDEMSMRFDLSIFVGNRFYIFNYATKQTGGYVDVDWFSTEPTFSEDTFYGYDVMHAYPVEDVTAVELHSDKENGTLYVLPGSTAKVKLTCTLQNGKKIDVSSACTYETDRPGMLKAQGGHLVGVKMGGTKVTATYTDALGNKVSTSFNVMVDYFPMSASATDANLIGAGTVRDATGYMLVKPAKAGMVGWHYENGIDLTPYLDTDPYLYIYLNRTVTSKPVLRFYDVNDINSKDFYATEVFGSEEIVCFDLEEIGKHVDLGHIYYIGFYIPTASSLQVQRMFFDASPILALDINEVEETPQVHLLRVEYFTPDGTQHDTLQPGINIVRRVYSDGHMEGIKVIK